MISKRPFLHISYRYYLGYLTKVLSNLSCTGGHPENWTLVLDQCLSVIEASVNKFKNAIEEEMKLIQLKANEIPCKNYGATSPEGNCS